MINNNRRRNFRPRPQKSNFRRRNGSVNSSNSNNLGNGGNNNFNRNGSMNNVHNVEKTIRRFTTCQILRLNGVLSYLFLQNPI